MEYIGVYIKKTRDGFRQQQQEQQQQQQQQECDHPIQW